MKCYGIPFSPAVLASCGVMINYAPFGFMHLLLRACGSDAPTGAAWGYLRDVAVMWAAFKRQIAEDLADLLIWGVRVCAVLAWNLRNGWWTEGHVRGGWTGETGKAQQLLV